ncbi:hypothetical protein LINPERHAP2_LOCUS6003, partial [Linum perenne]
MFILSIGLDILSWRPSEGLELSSWIPSNKISKSPNKQQITNYQIKHTKNHQINNESLFNYKSTVQEGTKIRRRSDSRSANTKATQDAGLVSGFYMDSCNNT